jgi:primosomal protein N''
MNKVIAALDENLQIIYRKAIDADTALDSLQSSGKGKFNTIFGDETPFTCRSKRFKDYVEELAGDVARLQAVDSSDTDSQEQKLSEIVRKLELLLKTLEQFKKSI